MNKTRQVYSFPKAVVTKEPQTGDLKKRERRCLTVVEASSPRPRCQWDQFPLQPLGDNPLLPLPVSSHPSSSLFLNNSFLSLVPFAFYMKQQRGAWSLLPRFSWKCFHPICIQVYHFYVPLSCQRQNVIQSSSLPLCTKGLLSSDV